MEQQRNPIVKGLVDQLSDPEVQMLDALEAAYRLLESEAAALYEAGADMQAIELDAAAEAIVVRIEEIAEEVLGEGGGLKEGDDLTLLGQEVEQISLEADLADAYVDWIRFTLGQQQRRHFESRDDFTDLLRRIVHLHPSHGKPLAESVSDDQLFEAARDAYHRDLELRQVLKK